MNRILLAFAATTAILAWGSLSPNSAQASPLNALKSLQLATEGLELTQNVQLCFYLDGWNGPGFYRCGYQHRRGLGWHGTIDSRLHNRRESRRGVR
jgi:hypothetical protein